MDCVVVRFIGIISAQVTEGCVLNPFILCDLRPHYVRHPTRLGREVPCGMVRVLDVESMEEQ